MTRMLSNVKKYILYFEEKYGSHGAVWIQTERWLKTAVWAHDTQTTALGWIKEASVTLDTSFDGRLLQSR